MMTLQTLLLCWNLTADLPPEAFSRCVQVSPGAVAAAEDRGIEPAVLLAVGWHESKWTTPKRRRVCGMWQTAGVDCDAVEASPAVAASEGARILSNWRRAAVRRGGGMREALAGYACGWKGLSGACGWYARSVLALAAKGRG